MGTFLRLGVRQKVLLVLLIVLTGALTLSGWLLFESQREQLVLESRQNGETIMRHVSRSLAYSVVGYDYHTVQLVLDELVALDDIAYAKVLSRKGNVMAEAGTLPTSGVGTELLHTSINIDAETVGELYMGIGNERIISRLEDERNMLIQRELLVILLIAIGEFAALSYLIIRPVRIISQTLTADAEQPGTIDREISIDTRDEFGDMAQRFNAMRRNLNEAHEKLRSRIVAADQELAETNRALVRQSNELRRANDALERMTITDELTGLRNRRHFDQVLRTDVASSIRYEFPYSLILLDLDHFKRINDTYGHDVGDLVLKETANLIKGLVRATDIVCRVGGEEFVILCEHTDHDAALTIAEKVRASLAVHDIEIGDSTVKVTASAGIATIPDDGDTKDARTLLRNADRAMYFSKNRGRNRVTHYRDIAHDPLLDEGIQA